MIFVTASDRVHAQPRFGSGLTDAQVLQSAKLVVTTARIELYEFQASASPKLAELAEQALDKIFSLGFVWDTKTYGAQKIKLIVSGTARVSHVLGGYEHNKYPQPVLFLNLRAAQAALSGQNATYAHELSHLVTWRFFSHTLREGLADYLAMQVLPGAGVGPNSVAGSSGGQGLDPEIAMLLGTTSPPPAQVLSNPEFRAKYYASSYRFVNHLVKIDGLPKFLQLYASPDPEKSMLELYGKSREELVKEIN